MSDVYSSKQRQQALSQLVERSALDEALRERLLRDPSATLREEAGVEPDTPVRFVEPGNMSASTEADSDTRVIVLPEMADDELSEDQLEAVAGGQGPLGEILGDS